MQIAAFFMYCVPEYVRLSPAARICTEVSLSTIWVFSTVLALTVVWLPLIDTKRFSSCTILCNMLGSGFFGYLGVSWGEIVWIISPQLMGLAYLSELAQATISRRLKARDDSGEIGKPEAGDKMA
jgi:hypothetical protein